MSSVRVGRHGASFDATTQREICGRQLDRLRLEDSTLRGAGLILGDAIRTGLHVIT